MRKLLRELKLELHPEKTKRVDLGWGKQGIDFLGGHLRKRFSGPVWEKSRRRVYFLQRWPSTRSMNLKPGEARRWTPRYFYALGLHRLLGTIAYPEAA